MTAIISFRTELLTEGNPDFTYPWDHPKYIFMAEHPFQFHLAPFSWRIINPLIASILPFSLQFNFFIISFCSVAVTGLLIYLLLKSTGSDIIVSSIGVLIFYSTVWATKWPLYDFWLTDGMVMMFMTAMIVQIIKNKETGFLILLSIGVLLKESALLALPLHYTLHARRIFDSRALRRTFLLSIPAIAILATVRISIPAQNNDPLYVASLGKSLRIEYPDHSVPGKAIIRDEITMLPSGVHYSYIAMAKKIGWNRLVHLKLVDVQIMTVRTFGVATLVLALFGCIAKKELILRYMPFILLVYFQLAFSVNTERVLIIALPAIIILAATGIKFLLERKYIDYRIVLLIFSLIILLNLKNTSPTPYMYGMEWFIVCSTIIAVVTIREFYLRRRTQ
ncbi:MAG: hypothetical protein WCX28_11835 [Bacteriovoracaceae bacterium]